MNEDDSSTFSLLIKVQVNLFHKYFGTKSGCSNILCLNFTDMLVNTIYFLKQNRESTKGYSR